MSESESQRIERIYPDQWLELSARKRDILVLLARDAPASGAEIHRGIGGPDVEGRVASSELYADLGDLAKDNLVTVDRRDGRTHEYTPAPRALVLVDHAAETLQDARWETSR